MAFKTVKSKVEYQVTELVNNLTEANSTQSEQKKDYLTARAMYYAQRLNKTLSKARITAMAVVLVATMASCSNASTTDAATTADTVATAPAVDTAGGNSGIIESHPVK